MKRVLSYAGTRQEGSDNGPMNGGFTIPQSAVLAYRVVGQGMEILLVTSRTRGRWVLPKGMITSGMTPAESAAKEAWEEAGIIGSVSRGCLGVYRYNKVRRYGVKACTVKVYAMKVTTVLRTWPEQRLRKRRWMRVDEAICSVVDRDLKRLLITFHASLRSRSLSFRNLAPHGVRDYVHASHIGFDDGTSSVGACRHARASPNQGGWRAGKQSGLTAVPHLMAGNGCAAAWGEDRRPGGRTGRSGR